jgi:hypothetical protein
MESSITSLNQDDEIKPYRIHVSPHLRLLRFRSSFPLTNATTKVSSKYLDITRTKLELTRLPHELLLPKARGWENGAPKAEIEPLIDFW